MHESRAVLIAVAPNGARRTKADHTGLPMTAHELARAAAACREAGAAMLHLHVRDRDGAHCLDAGLYRDAIATVRDAIGDAMVIQITTEAVGRFTPREQMAVAEAVRPEALSLGLRELCPDPSHEAAFGTFLRFLSRERIAVQIILYDPSDVAHLIDLVGRGIVPDDRLAVLYVLGSHGAARPGGPADLLSFLAAAGERLPDFMACAFGPREAACGVAAALLGGDVRVGFENNLHMPDGTLAPDNAALVTTIAEPLTGLGHRLATADQLRARWFA